VTDAENDAYRVVFLFKAYWEFIYFIITTGLVSIDGTYTNKE